MYVCVQSISYNTLLYVLVGPAPLPKWGGGGAELYTQEIEDQGKGATQFFWTAII